MAEHVRNAPCLGNGTGICWGCSRIRTSSKVMCAGVKLVGRRCWTRRNQLGGNVQENNGIVVNRVLPVGGHHITWDAGLEQYGTVGGKV